MKSFLIYILALFLLGCGGITNSKPQFSNTGISTVLNGRNQIDSLKYKCDSCLEILQDKVVFDTIIFITTAEAKAVLKNKLSFVPVSVDLNVSRQDSLYYTDGKKIDSLVTVIANYKCIGKNGYGVEDEVESSNLIYLVNNKVVNLDGKIKKRPLELDKEGIISRNLSLYGEKDNIDITPIKSKHDIHLIAKTSESCVENATLEITFEDNEKISLRSWNKFNCDNNSYFRLDKADLEKLKAKPIRYISFSEDNFAFCPVPENNRDYFIQFARLVE